MDIDKDFVNQVLKRLDFHSERLNAHDRIVSDVKAMRREMAETNLLVKNNNRFLYGNGGKEVGLDEDVRNIKKSIEILSAQINGWTKTGKWIVGVAGAYVIVEIIKFVLAGIAQ